MAGARRTLALLVIVRLLRRLDLVEKTVGIVIDASECWIDAPS